MQTVEDYHRQQGDDCEAESVTATAVLGDLGAPSVSPVPYRILSFQFSITDVYVCDCRVQLLLITYLPWTEHRFLVWTFEGSDGPF